jgi:hypothetical protein
MIVNNDGVHPSEMPTAKCALAGGFHRIRVSYFRGPAGVLWPWYCAWPDQEWRIFSTEEFKPPSDPATWTYQGQALRMSSATSAPGEKVRLEGSLDSATTRALSVLKWELAFLAQLLEPEGDGSEARRAAMGSNESLTCTEQKPYSYSCNLSYARLPLAVWG